MIAEVTAAGLLGRGGAAFPTGRKWEAVRSEPATPHYLICNADESEPGTFKDRVLMEEDPFAVIESMAIAAFATTAFLVLMLVDCSWIAFATYARRLLRTPRAMRIANRLGATAMGGAALAIATRR